MAVSLKPTLPMHPLAQPKALAPEKLQPPHLAIRLHLPHSAEMTVEKR